MFDGVATASNPQGAVGAYGGQCHPLADLRSIASRLSKDIAPMVAAAAGKPQIVPEIGCVGGCTC